MTFRQRCRLGLFTTGIACSAGFSSAASLHAAILVTRPVHVQAVTQDSVTIIWHTDQPAFAAVDYGPTLEYGRSAERKSASRQHAITLHRLNAGSTYYYRVRCDAEILAAGPEYRFRSLPDKRTTRFRMLVWGDSGRGDSTQYSLVPIMEASHADFMVHVGDVSQTNGAAGTYGPQYFVPYQNLLRNTPVWPVIGNHDVMTGDGQPFLDAFFLPANNPALDERYYSFNYGQAHFLALDTNRPFGTPILEWMERDLATTTTKWKFAIMHHPMYSCGVHGSVRSLRDLLAPIFEMHGVDIVFCGHDHDYQRSHPMLGGVPVGAEQGPDFVAPQGIFYIVTGGGSVVRPTSASCTFTAAAISKTHCTVVDVDGTFLRLRALDAQGSTLDEITIEKQAPPPQRAELAATARAGIRIVSNAPNPFNPTTRVSYELGATETVELTIHDVRGHTVRGLFVGRRGPGPHSVVWDGRDALGHRASSGIYIVRLRTDRSQVTRKIALAP